MEKALPTPPAPATPQPDAPRPHLAQRVSKEDSRRCSKNVFRAYGLDMVPEWAVGLAVAGLLGAGLLPAMRISAVVLLMAAALAATLIALLIRQSATRSRFREAFPVRSDPAARIRIVAPGHLLERLAPQITESLSRGGTDVAEPEDFPVTFSGESGWTLAVRSLIAAGAGVGLLTLIPAAGGLALRNAFLALLAALAIGRVLWGFLWPTTVRVLPRRIDIIRHGVLGSKCRGAIESYDLATSRVLIDLRTGRLFIQHEEADLGLWLSGVCGTPIRGGRDMGMAVLNAALSRYQPPIGVSDDE